MSRPSQRHLPIIGEVLPPGQRPHCRRCTAELRPNFEHVWDHSQPLGQQIVARTLLGYGVWDNGLFCSKDCATVYAHKVVWVLERDGRIQDSTGKIL